MVLAFAEKNPKTGAMQLKWLSSDKAMIVTEGGRIIKTLGLAEANLSNITPISASSLPSLASILKNQTTWSAHYDWMLNDHYLFNYKANITPVLRGKSTIETTVWNKDVTEVVEVISIPSLDYSFTNQYWLDEQFNVVKTHQYLGPDIGDIEMTILKPFAL